VRFLHRHCPQTAIQVVEIAPAVVAAARPFFRLPEETALRDEIGDGAKYVEESDRQFDLVLVDGFDRNARAGKLDTAPFYENVRARLSDTGLMSANLFGRSRGFRASVERILTAFDGRAIAFPSCDSGNVVAFAAMGERISIPVAELREGAQALKEKTGLDLRATVTRLEQAGSLPGGQLVL